MKLSRISINEVTWHFVNASSEAVKVQGAQFSIPESHNHQLSETDVQRN